MLRLVREAMVEPLLGVLPGAKRLKSDPGIPISDPFIADILDDFASSLRRKVTPSTVAVPPDLARLECASE